MIYSEIVPTVNVDMGTCKKRCSLRNLFHTYQSLASNVILALISAVPVHSLARNREKYTAELYISSHNIPITRSNTVHRHPTHLTNSKYYL